MKGANGLAKAQREFAYNEMRKAARLKKAGFDELAKIYEESARRHFKAAKTYESRG